MLIMTMAGTLLLAQDPPDPDVVAMEGSWVATSWVSDGKDNLEDNGAAAAPKLIVDEGRFAWVFARNARIETTLVGLNSQGTPKTMDLRSQRDGQIMKAIYRLDGDTLTICSSHRGERPTEFQAFAGSGRLLRVMKRVKPEK